MTSISIGRMPFWSLFLNPDCHWATPGGRRCVCTLLTLARYTLVYPPAGLSLTAASHGPFVQDSWRLHCAQQCESKAKHAAHRQMSKKIKKAKEYAPDTWVWVNNAPSSEQRFLSKLTDQGGPAWQVTPKQYVTPVITSWWAEVYGSSRDCPAD